MAEAGERTFGVYGPADLHYDDRGFVSAVAQVASTKEIVMVGVMTEQTLRRTLELGQAVFWSRTRGEQWHKGATSGDYLNVLSITTNCYQTALLLQVEPVTGVVCHTGAHSDFVEADDRTARVVRA